MRWIFDAFKYACVDWRLQGEVRRRYYVDPKFSCLDRSLLQAYIFKNPYQISKRYLKRRQEEDIHTYGETPLMTYETIAKEVELDSQDLFLELGSGRGRGLFFLQHFFQCQVIGVERIPLFVKLSEHIIHNHQLEKVSIFCGDMAQVKLPKASVIYLYGTCLQDRDIHQIIQKIQSFPQGTKVVSVSYSLLDYDAKALNIEKTFSVSFPWGETTAYLQTVK